MKSTLYINTIKDLANALMLKRETKNQIIAGIPIIKTPYLPKETAMLLVEFPDGSIDWGKSIIIENLGKETKKNIVGG